MNELISIIVPIYNVENYLLRCVKSLCLQTYKNLEIILVDDGSSDRCPELCEEAKLKDDRIIVIHKKNGGLSDARNFGIEIAKGEYLAFVDSDDYVAPNYIETLYMSIKENNSDMSFCNFTCIDENNDEVKDNNGFIRFAGNRILSEEDFWHMYYFEHDNYCVAWNKLYSAKLFEKFRYEKGKLNEDEFIIHKLISNCKRISCCEDNLYYYLIRSNSIMGTIGIKFNFDVIYALLERYNYFLSKNWFLFADECMRAIFKILVEKQIQAETQIKKYNRLVLNSSRRGHSLKFLIDKLLFKISKPAYIRLHKLNRRRK